MKRMPDLLRSLRGSHASEPLVMAFHEDTVLLERTLDDAGVGLPTSSVFEHLGLDARFPMPAGEVDGVPVTAWDVPHLPDLPDGWRREGVRALFGIVDEQLFALLGRGAHLIHWRRTSQHCGVCGSGTEMCESELAVRCPACGYTQFPRISPSVVVLIEDGSRCLLTHEPAFQNRLFTCLAGFMEPGESVEQAIRREVHEEVGLEISDLRYFGSQPWPYPDGLMMGFHARYVSGALRKRDGELEEARWFAATDLPLLPGSFSLARQLIEDFRIRAAETAP